MLDAWPHLAGNSCLEGDRGHFLFEDFESSIARLRPGACPGTDGAPADLPCTPRPAARHMADCTSNRRLPCEYRAPTESWRRVEAVCLPKQDADWNILKVRRAVTTMSAARKLFEGFWARALKPYSRPLLDAILGPGLQPVDVAAPISKFSRRTKGGTFLRRLCRWTSKRRSIVCNCHWSRWPYQPKAPLSSWWVGPRGAVSRVRPASRVGLQIGCL